LRRARIAARSLEKICVAAREAVTTAQSRSAKVEDFADGAKNAVLI
jgi:hypothetical protein